MLIPTYINNKRKLSTDNNANIQKRKQALERIYKKDINLSEKIDTIFAFCNYTRTAPIIQAVKHLYDNHTIKRIVFINTHATTNKTHTITISQEYLKKNMSLANVAYTTVSDLTAHINSYKSPITIGVVTRYGHLETDMLRLIEKTKGNTKITVASGLSTGELDDKNVDDDVVQRFVLLFYKLNDVISSR